jgi:osmotically-inducible protein OsmY
MTDTQLNDHVHHVLSRTPYWAGKNLQVENQGGRITLRGVVGTYYQKQMAQEVLRRVDGVSQISNELEVHWT